MKLVCNVYMHHTVGLVRLGVTKVRTVRGPTVY